MTMRRTVTTMLGLMLGCALIGCDPLTHNRFELITVGTAAEIDVEKTIGKPNYKQADRWHYERPDRHLNVIIDFGPEGIVARKQWISAATGTWTDTEETGDTSSRERTRVRTIK